jgi:hypothetical protein
MIIMKNFTRKMLYLLAVGIGAPIFAASSPSAEKATISLLNEIGKPINITISALAKKSSGTYKELASSVLFGKPEEESVLSIKLLPDASRFDTAEKIELPSPGDYVVTAHLAIDKESHREELSPGKEFFTVGEVEDFDASEQLS